jgi:hypothetical protein
MQVGQCFFYAILTKLLLKQWMVLPKGPIFVPSIFLHFHQAHARIPMSDIDRQADNQGFTLGIVGWRCCVFGFLALVASIPCCAPAGSKGGKKLPCI